MSADDDGNVIPFPPQKDFPPQKVVLLGPYGTGLPVSEEASLRWQGHLEGALLAETLDSTPPPKYEPVEMNPFALMAIVSTLMAIVFTLTEAPKGFAQGLWAVALMTAGATLGWHLRKSSPSS